MPVARSKAFKPNVAAEKQFATSLRRVAKQAAHVVEVHTDKHRIFKEAEMMRRLRDYSEALEPWAVSQSARMIARVTHKNGTAFRKSSKKIGKLIRETVASSELGRKAKALMDEQVALIKSIPIRAGERAQKLALEAYYNGDRADVVAAELKRTGKVSESDADGIARTEVARANAVVTQARAQAAGSNQYLWHNSGDAEVRDAHKYLKGKPLEGQVFSWDHPPTLDDGTTGHPGTFPNCRCYAEPFFPDT